MHGPETSNIPSRPRRSRFVRGISFLCPIGSSGWVACSYMPCQPSALVASCVSVGGQAAQRRRRRRRRREEDKKYVIANRRQPRTGDETLGALNGHGLPSAPIPRPVRKAYVHVSIFSNPSPGYVTPRHTRANKQAWAARDAAAAAAGGSVQRVPVPTNLLNHFQPPPPHTGDVCSSCRATCI